MTTPPPPPPPWLPPPPPSDSAALGSIAPVGPPLPPPPARGWEFRPTPVSEYLGRIDDGIRWYLATLALTLLSAVISAAYVGYVVSGVFSGGSLSTSAASSLSPGVSDGLSLSAFVVLILTIVSWVKWRSGVLYLSQSAIEYGTGYLHAADTARKDYSRAVWSFLAILIGSIIFSIVLAAYVLSQLANSCSQFGANNTTCLSNGVAVSAGGVVGGILAFGLVAALLEFLQYYFASRSLVDALRPLASSEGQQRLDRGRLAMVVGAALTPVGLVNAGLILLGRGFPPLGFVGLLTPLLLLYGLYEIHQAYAAWLARPVPPGGLGLLAAPPYPPRS
jgi:hypothetical protein